MGVYDNIKDFLIAVALLVFCSIAINFHNRVAASCDCNNEPCVSSRSFGYILPIIGVVLGVLYISYMVAFCD